MSPPLMPTNPILDNDASMLTRKFGKEVINYYAGSALNRYSFLRPDTAFLRKAVLSPSSRFLALNSLSPLVQSPSELALLKFDDVKPLVGEDLFELSEEDEIKSFDSNKRRGLVVFLGIGEGDGSETFESSGHGNVKGLPYFAVDVTPRGSVTDAANALLKKQEETGHTWQTNPRSMSLHAEAAAMYAQARSMIDWNTRNSFCGGCGNPNLAVHAGYKRVCPTTDAASTSERPDCHTRHGVSNLCFPRTDPTMISAVVSSDGQKVLLGRQTRFPKDWFSTLAGFLEPGESIEEAVRREVWEEAGVKVGRVVIHSSQPWPYPSSLMIGAIAQAVPGGEEITLNDKELESAKWFSMEDVRRALSLTTGGLDAAAPEGYKEGDLRLPPQQAIANRLITAVAEGFLAAVSKI